MKFPQDIECIIDPIQNCGGIYISNLEAAQNLQTLKKFNIDAVITVARGHILKHTQKQLPTYLYLPADDHQSFNISKYFQQSNEFLDKYTKRTNVLVHCLAGVSRSVTIVLAYLIKKYGYSLKQAFKLILNRRNKIHPNEGFLKQLQEFEKKIRQNNSENNDIANKFNNTLFVNQSFNTTKNNIHSNTSSNFYRPLAQSKVKAVNSSDYDQNLKNQIKRLFSPDTKFLIKNECKENRPISSNFYAIKKQLGSIQQNLKQKNILKKSSSNKNLTNSSLVYPSGIQKNFLQKIRYL